MSISSDEPPVPSPSPHPPAINYVLSFLLVSLAWGMTTPFIRRAARSHRPPPHPVMDIPGVRDSPVWRRLYGAYFGVVDLLRNPRYAVPLVLNLTGSVWFFLLIGQAGELPLFLNPRPGCFSREGREREREREACREQDGER
jgi:hypothetical protein